MSLNPVAGRGNDIPLVPSASAGTLANVIDGPEPAHAETGEADRGSVFQEKREKSGARFSMNAAKASAASGE